MRKKCDLSKAGVRVFFSGLLLVSITGRAQESAPESAPPVSKGELKDVESDPPSQKPEVGGEHKRDDSQKRYEGQMSEVELWLQQQIDELRQQQKSADDASEDGGAGLSLAEQWAAEPELETKSFERLLNVYGFFDVTFFKNYFPAPDSPAVVAVSDRATFMMSNVSIILQSEMTRSLSAMVELKFSFMPNGHENNFNVYLDDATVPVVRYDRTNTWQRSLYNTKDTWPGSVMIERAHVTWAPRDWFKVLAGRFLTPFGVWNVEHSPTVIIPVHEPYMQIRRMVPPTQLGAQIFGRFYLRHDTSVEYFLTVSNGRDGEFPTENVDLDNNKALGLGLRATLDKVNWSATLGGYGYYGKSTDIEKSIHVDTAFRSLTGKTDEIAVQNEAIASAFLMLQIYRLRLQSEGVLTYFDMETPQPLDILDRFFMTGDIAADWYGRPSYTGRGLYTLVAYELPFDRLNPILKILPYVLYEYNMTSDTQPYRNNDFFSVGINWRPAAWAALKLEYSMVTPKSDEVGGRIHSGAAQLAVSF